MREMLGFTSQEPQENDKIICLRNQWETFSNVDNALVNGTIGHLKKPFKTYYNIYPYYTIENSTRMPILHCDFQVEDTDEEFKELNLDYRMMQTGESILN